LLATVTFLLKVGLVKALSFVIPNRGLVTSRKGNKPLQFPAISCKFLQALTSSVPILESKAPSCLHHFQCSSHLPILNISNTFRPILESKSLKHIHHDPSSSMSFRCLALLLWVNSIRTLSPPCCTLDALGPYPTPTPLPQNTLLDSLDGSPSTTVHHPRFPH